MTHAKAWFGLIVLTILTRLPAILHPAAIDDEKVYAVVANVMLDGGLPYRNAIERKPPLLFWVYSSVFDAFGKYNWAALHWVAVGWVLLTMVGLYVIGSTLHGRTAGILAAGFYSVLQPFATAKNLAFNGEVLMNLPIVWGYALGLGCLGRTRNRLEVVLAGGLLGFAFLLKQPAAIAALPLGLYLLLSNGVAEEGCRPRAGLWAASLFGAGFAFVLGLVALALYRDGILAEAYYWTITDHSIQYVFWERALEHTALFAAAALPIIIAPVFFRAQLAAAWSGHRDELATTGGWAIVSIIGVAAGGRFYPHYYIQLIPPLAVLCCPFYAILVQRYSADAASARQLRRAAGWLGVGAAVTVVVQLRQLSEERAASPPARFVAEHSLPRDRLFVWGQATGMYLEAQRQPASRYIATFPLTGYIFGMPLRGVSTKDRIVRGSWQNLKKDFVHLPRFIIDAETGPDARYPTTEFPYLSNLLAVSYHRVYRSREGDVYVLANEVNNEKFDQAWRAG